MCSICNSVFCPPSCPGYDDQDRGSNSAGALAVCDCCGEELFIGEEATIIEDYVLCSECVKSFTVVLTPENAPINE